MLRFRFVFEDLCVGGIHVCVHMDGWLDQTMDGLTDELIKTSKI